MDDKMMKPTLFRCCVVIQETPPWHKVSIKNNHAFLLSISVIKYVMKGVIDVTGLGVVRNSRKFGSSNIVEEDTSLK